MKKKTKEYVGVAASAVAALALGSAVLVGIDDGGYADNAAIHKAAMEVAGGHARGADEEHHSKFEAVTSRMGMRELYPATATALVQRVEGDLCTVTLTDTPLARPDWKSTQTWPDSCQRLATAAWAVSL